MSLWLSFATFASNFGRAVFIRNHWSDGTSIRSERKLSLPLFRYRWFSRYVIAAMLVDVNKRILIRSFCSSTSNCTLQHCYLCPQRLAANHLYELITKIKWTNRSTRNGLSEIENLIINNYLFTVQSCPLPIIYFVWYKITIISNDKYAGSGLKSNLEWQKIFLFFLVYLYIYEVITFPYLLHFTWAKVSWCQHFC